MTTNKPETEPKVFIIESLEFEDEDKNYFEGGIISEILRLSEIETKYYYVRTKKEFKKVLSFFKESNYRYLHISCHGGDNSIWTTFDEINNDKLGLLLKDLLYKKRLFLSACSVVNEEIAKSIIPSSQCNSIIGPKNNIAFRDSAIMWAAFYHLMFNDDQDDSIVMSRAKLLKNLQKIVNTFEQPLEYFSISKSKGIKNSLIKPKQ
ncbi:hypothetical protein [Ferruginibacter sp.]